MAWSRYTNRCTYIFMVKQSIANSNIYSWTQQQQQQQCSSIERWCDGKLCAADRVSVYDWNRSEGKLRLGVRETQRQQEFKHVVKHFR